MENFELSELTRSQLPALHLLQNLGYTYLSPREALALRGGRADAVLLESVLLDWLARNNEIQYHGQRYPFSEANIHTAVQVLKETLSIGLLRTDESIFDLLSLGKSLPQSVTLIGNIPRRTFTMWRRNSPSNAAAVTKRDDPTWCCSSTAFPFA